MAARRRLVVTARGAAELPPTTTSPYVVLHLGGEDVQTGVARVAGANPVRGLPLARPLVWLLGRCRM